MLKGGDLRVVVGRSSARNVMTIDPDYVISRTKEKSIAIITIVIIIIMMIVIIY